MSNGQNEATNKFSKYIQIVMIHNKKKAYMPKSKYSRILGVSFKIPRKRILKYPKCKISRKLEKSHTFLTFSLLQKRYKYIARVKLGLPN